MTRNGSPLTAVNLPWIEDLHDAWSRDHGSVDGRWDEIFRREESIPAVERRSAARTAVPRGTDFAFKQSRVTSMINGFREVGYIYAHLNPLAPEKGEESNFYTEPTHTYAQLTLAEFDLGEAELDEEFSTGGALSTKPMKLRDIIAALEDTYCSSLAVEFMHIQNKPMRRWLIQEMESTRNRPSLSPEKKRLILEDLFRAEEFEHFMHTAFIGQKRFSLEGCESVIPALHHVADTSSFLGITDIILGMTHRGRLTVLNRIMEKPIEEVFSEFEGHEEEGDYGGSGDVRYHLGYEKEHVGIDGRKVRINLVANPSHLESVGPVVEGMARAVQREREDTERRMVMPVILHGDSAFSGQGIVAEVFNLANLKGYKTGGTLHIIINNQIGFTTSSRDARSTFFSTDVAKMLPIPVFHVNGEDPEAVVYAVDLALRFRQTFGRDAVVDIFGYRKYGHNEGDDPSFTHPLMYRIIEKKKSPPTLYAQKCRAEGVTTEEQEEQIKKEFRQQLRKGLETARAAQSHTVPAAPVRPPAALDPDEPVPVPSEEQLHRIAARITTVPEDFHIHPKLKRIIDEKVARLAKDGTVDWAFAESLAFGTLLVDGVPIRLSGQDSSRGTFSQRHLVWWDTDSRLPLPYTPLTHVPPTEIQFSVYDSPLSEYSILAFEYGFTLGRPRALVMWEAQFGDFSNGAQVITDNYVAGGEAKWGTVSGIVLLLPHGFEGQGPEHSSGHLERFLLLCAKDNIQVVNCTTPAQYFHLLRRQALRTLRKPLIVMTPKSLLRHPRAVSPIASLAEGGFQEVLDDPSLPRKARRLVLCSGKIYYELAARRDELKDTATVILRVEQLYPFPAQRLAELFKSYPGITETAWVQEEPRNRGAWGFMHEMFDRSFPEIRVGYVGREEAASPATGSHSRHEREQRQLVDAAFTSSGQVVAGESTHPDAAPSHGETGNGGRRAASGRAKPGGAKSGGAKSGGAKSASGGAKARSGK
jgi:2-oxoglutarate dehydrogenase E1 component